MLRFSDYDVLTHWTGVREAILEALTPASPTPMKNRSFGYSGVPSPNLSRCGGRRTVALRPEYFSSLVAGR